MIKFESNLEQMLTQTTILVNTKNGGKVFPTVTCTHITYK